MTQDFTPVEINTQGLDTDLNSNFLGLQNEIDAEKARATAAENTIALNLNSFENATLSALSQKADLNGSTVQRFKVADAIDATEAISKQQLDAVSSLVSYTVAAGTVLNVPSQYADINAALNYLKGKTLLGSVTIHIADGTYSYTSAISINHPQSDFIKIQGNTSNRSAVTLNFINCYGFTCYYGRRISLDSLTVNGNNNGINMGVNCFSYGYFHNVVISNFYQGILLRNGYIDLDTCLITSNSNTGIAIYGGAYCGLNNCSITNNYNGLNADACSFMQLTASTSVTNNTIGLRVVDCSFSYIGAGCTINNNTTNAIYTANNSFVLNDGGSISGTLSPTANTIGNINSYIQT